MTAIFQIEDIFQIPGQGTVVTGVVKMGVIKKGMKANINGIETEITKIQRNYQDVEEANVDESCGLLLRGISKEDLKGVTVIHFE